jgi:hypothetical protein
MVKTVSQIIEEVSPYYKKEGKPETSHTIIYDSPAETLEPLYFFVLDLMNDFGLNPEKLIDNFASSPGSGHFGEMGQRSAVMQQQGAQTMERINAILRSVLNLVYDLKDFRIRLSHYDDVNAKDEAKVDAARMALKQVWMDKVDINKGQSSIKAMALGQAGFQTLIDAFLIAKDEKTVNKLDLNDRVKRILLQRVYEFNGWLMHSEKELRKRYEMERAYLKSQVNSLKLYSRWAKPYLKAAAQLEQNTDNRSPALVKAFSTTILELTILGKRTFKVKEAAIEGDLPKEFGSDKFLKKIKRKYHTCILIDFNFRGIPQKASQRGDYAFGGRTEITFKGYSLNDDEIAKFEEELAKSDIEDTLKLINGATDESLEQIQDEINFFLNEEEKKEEKKKTGEVNPFLAILGKYDKEEKKEKSKDKKEVKEIKPDDWYEENYYRKLVGTDAKDTAFLLFDIYKKSHGMASFT